MGSQVQSDLKVEIDEILKEVARSKNIINYESKINFEAQVGDGFVAQFYSAEIVNSESGEIISVAIKKAPSVEWDIWSAFKNEATLYDRVFPALDSLQKRSHLTEPFDNIPELYCYGLEPKKEYFAMENLKTKGYALLDKKAYLTKEHLDLLFKVYGKFHALSFVWRKQNIEDYLKIHKEYCDLSDLFVGNAVGHAKTALAAAIEALDPASEVYDVAKALVKNLKDVFFNESTYTGDYRCSTHGDCWSNNMMFKYSDSGKLEDVKLLDFQLARDSSPIHDLSYFFYSGASKTDMDDLEHYLQIYHDSMSEVFKQLGENPAVMFPYSTLVQEWKNNALYGVILGAYIWQIKLLPKEDCIDYLKGDENSTAVSRTTKFEKLLSKILKSDAFRERTSALLIHAYEFQILTKEKVMVKTADSADTSVPEVQTTHL